MINKIILHLGSSNTVSTVLALFSYSYLSVSELTDRMYYYLHVFLITSFSFELYTVHENSVKRLCEILFFFRMFCSYETAQTKHRHLKMKLAKWKDILASQSIEFIWWADWRCNFCVHFNEILYSLIHQYYKGFQRNYIQKSKNEINEKYQNEKLFPLNGSALQVLHIAHEPNH